MNAEIVQAEEVAKDAMAVADDWLEAMKDSVIENDEDQRGAALLLQNVKANYKSIEKEREKITVPMNAALKAVNDLFRPPREKLLSLEKILKTKIAEYLQRKALANHVAIQAAASAPTSEAAIEQLAKVELVEAPAGVSVREVEKFEVVNPEQVPRYLCSPDTKKIQDELAKGNRAIPGVRVFKEAVVSARRA
jgi:hypothetical protein